MARYLDNYARHNDITKEQAIEIADLYDEGQGRYALKHFVVTGRVDGTKHMFDMCSEIKSAFDSLFAMGDMQLFNGLYVIDLGYLFSYVIHNCEH